MKLKTLFASLAVFATFSSMPVSLRAADTGTSTRLAQGDARLAKLESLMLGYVNDARRKEGLNALTLNDKLAQVARAHSAEMRDKNYFAHESPTANLKEPLDRYNAVFGDTPHLLAENIFRSWTTGARHEVNESDALRAHDALMKSPGHRANILLAGVTQIGIGIIANDNGDLWVTQMFLKP